MKLKLIFIFVSSLCYFSNGFSGLLNNQTLIVVAGIHNDLEELIGTPWQKCGTCICYAKTLCQNITNCFDTPENCGAAITQDYWNRAESPSIFGNMNEEAAYKACMRNENCILNTIKRYTNSIGNIDCTDDGVYDCRDKFYIHLHGKDCHKNSRSSNFLLSRCFNRIGIESLESIELSVENQ